MRSSSLFTIFDGASIHRWEWSMGLPYLCGACHRVCVYVSKVFTFCFKTLVSVWSIDVASKSVRASGTAIVINLYLLVHTQHTFILFFFVPSPVLYYRTLNLSTIEHSKNICLFVQYVRSNRHWHTMPMAADGGQWKQKYIFFSSFFADAFLDK